MGNKVLRPSEMEPFSGFNDDQISYLKDKFQILCDSSKLLNVDKMAQSLCCTRQEATKVLNYIDFQGQGDVDFYQFTCAAASLHQNDEQSRQFLFDIFANGKEMDLQSFITFYGTVFRYLNFLDLIKEDYSNEVGEKKFKKYDFNQNGSIGFDEFTDMLKNDYHCKIWMEYLGFAEQSPKQLIQKPINDEIESGDGEFLLAQDKGDQAGSTPSWIKTINYMAPSDFQKPQNLDTPPSQLLDINYVYGYRSYDTRDNLKYNSNGQIVYHTAGVGIVLNKSKNTMKVTTVHNDDITCLDINVNKNLVVTGQMGKKPSLVVWDSNTLQTKAIFKDKLQRSISTVAISKSGKYVAATSMSDSHDIAVYDVQKKSLIAFGKGPKSVVYNIKFNNREDEVALACAKQVMFATFLEGTIKLKKGVFGKAPLLANYNIVTLGDAMVTSMSNGLLAYWKGNFCSRVYKQHTCAVGALCQRNDGGIISGDIKGNIVIWSMNMSKQKQISLQDTLNPIKSNHPRIIALSQQGNNILVGTRGGQIVQISNGQTGKILMQGHFDGQLWGMCVNTKKHEFITGGQDKLLIKWDINKRKSISKKKLQAPINSVDISCRNIIAAGMRNGIVNLYDYNTMNYKARIAKYKNPDKDMISVVKFSPDGNVLAVGYCPPISKVYLYDSESVKQLGQCKGSPSRIVSIDFTYDSSAIMINNTSYEILFYKSNNGAQITSATLFKEEKWATLTARFSWQSQGIWPPCSDGSDINTVDRSNNQKYLVTGDDFSKIKVFKYPVCQTRQIYNSYKGHSSHVTKVKWSFDDKYIISTGGLEKSIIQWISEDQEEIIYNFEEPEKQQEKPIEQEQKYDYEDQGQEGQGQAQGGDDGGFQLDVDQGDQALAVKPFLGQVKASTPLDYKVNSKANTYPEPDMKVHHVWGIRNQYISDRVRNQLKYNYNENGCLFITAALGVQMNFADKFQTFYQGHEQDLVCFAATKNREICATGQMAQLNLVKAKDKIVDVHVWDAKTKQQLAKLSRFHQRAVVLVQFSPSGQRLLTVGQDDKNSLAVYDWKINRIAWSSPVDNAKVTGAVWKNQTQYMTVGLKHVKFWTSGKGQMGKLSSKKWDPMVSAAYWNDKFISGGSAGSVYLWSGNLGNPTKGHEGRVDTLSVDLNGKLYSGCSKGIIIQWKYSGGKLVADHKVCDMAGIDKFDPGVLSLDFSSKGNMLVCTNSSSIYELQSGSIQSANIIMQSHFKDQLWAGAWSPDGKTFVTGGDDATIRIYDANTFQMKYSYQMKQRVRGIDWQQSKGQLIVVGDYKGKIYLFDKQLNLISDVKTKFAKTKPRKQPFWIEDIKFSPNGQYVAFGAHGGASHLEIYEVKDNKIQGNPKIIKSLITSALLSVDWSQSSDMLAIVSQAYELQFCDLQKRINASSVRDVQWATWSGKFGFCVQQIHQDVDYSNINAVCMSPSRTLIMAGYDDQKIRMFNYPVTIPKQKSKAYAGHSSHVTRVRFNRNQQFLLSQGGNDRTIILWKMIGNQIEEEVKQIQKQEQGEEQQEQMQNWQDMEDINFPKPRQQTPAKQQPENDDFQLDEDAGDQFMAVKPWLGAIKQPTVPYYKGSGKPPPVEINLEYAHGYRVKDCRNNLKYLSSTQICYHTAGVGVIMQIDKNPKKQRFFNKHTDDIISMTWNQDKTAMFTGQMGAKPIIYQWDQSGTQIQSYKGVKKGVSAIGVGQKYLVASGLDDDHNVFLFDKDQGKLIGSEKGGRDVIIDMKFTSQNSFVSIGIKHFKAWDITGKSMKGKTGIFGKNCNILCAVAVMDGKVYAGASNGQLQLWSGNSCTKVIKPHKGAINAICNHETMLLTGASDFKINIIDSGSMSVVNTIDCDKILAQSLNASIRAIDVLNNNILVGTLGSQIYEIKSNQAIKNTTSQGKYRLIGNYMNGHYAPNYVTNEVWGLTIIDPKSYATCSDDGTLRIWDLHKKQQITVGSLMIDEKLKPIVLKPKQKFLPDSVKGRCMAISPQKDFVIGCKDGTVRVLNSNLKHTYVKSISKKQISHIKFSPDGSQVIIGAHDAFIYMFQWNQGKMKLKYKCKKHSSYIKHFDFSRDGNFLHSTCGAYELLFWDTNTGKQITSGATMTRDEQWATWNVTFGWPVQGIFQQFMDGTDINAVDRSNNTYGNGMKFLASGDDRGKVRLLQFPCVVKNSESVKGNGHSSHVTNVMFTVDDQYVISTGGQDQTVMQWKIVPM